jgi:glutaredoxin 3
MIMAAAEILLYTSPLCTYCRVAKQILERKGAAYTEIDVYTDPQKLEEMIEKARGRKTVPQIFINGRHIGGADDLRALNDAGHLDVLLGK